MVLENLILLVGRQTRHANNDKIFISYIDRKFAKSIAINNSRSISIILIFDLVAFHFSYAKVSL